MCKVGKLGMMAFLDHFRKMGQEGVMGESKGSRHQPSLLFRISKNLGCSFEHTYREHTAVQPSLTSSLSLCGTTNKVDRVR